MLVTHFYSTEIPPRTSNSESGLGRQVFAVHVPNTQIKALLQGGDRWRSQGHSSCLVLLLLPIYPLQLCFLLNLSQSKLPFHYVKNQTLPAEFIPVSQRKTACFQPSMCLSLKSFSWLFAVLQNMKRVFKIYCFRVSGWGLILS